jgi:hypothetical protein
LTQTAQQRGIMSLFKKPEESQKPLSVKLLDVDEASLDSNEPIQPVQDSMKSMIKSALKCSLHDLPPLILSVLFLLLGLSIALFCYFYMSYQDMQEARSALWDRTKVGVNQLVLAQGNTKKLN